MQFLRFTCLASQSGFCGDTSRVCFFETLWPTPYVSNLLFLLSCLAVPFRAFLLGPITSPIKHQHRSFASGSVFRGNQAV